jgi:hypothetical protein
VAHQGECRPFRLNLTEISGFVRLVGPERLHGFLDERIEPLATLVQMMDDFLAHARVPEFGKMICDSGDRLVMPLGREEFPDLIGHIDKLLGRIVMRHDARLDQ